MAHFLIAGGGIGGLATARGFLQAGHTVQVVEAAPELREVGAGVVLGANAMRALHALDLHEAVRPHGTPVTRLDLRDQHGRLLQSADTTPFTRRLGFDNLGIHRAALQGALLASLPAGTVRLGCALQKFHQSADGVTATFADGSTATADALVAADGIHSWVRRQLVPTAQPRYAGYTCWRAVVDAADLKLPPGESCETWGTRGRRFGYVPVGEDKVYWFACVNSTRPGNPRFRAFTPADVQATFAGFHAPVPELLALTQPAQLLWNDIFDLAPLSHLAYGRVLLLGDAGHATTPNLGQGAGMAVEDAAALMQCLKEEAHLPTAFQRFEQRRLPRTTRVVRTSWHLGKVGQWEHPALTYLRNSVMRLLPSAVSRQQMAWLYKMDA